MDTMDFDGFTGCGPGWLRQGEPGAGGENLPAGGGGADRARRGPGGGYDLTVRAMAQCLQETGLVSVPLPVTNKPGGGGRVCLEYMHEKRGSSDMLVVYSPPLC